jgi:hypothetical protein
MDPQVGIEENRAVRLHKIPSLPSNTSFILTQGLGYIYARSLIITSECSRPFLAVEFGFSLDGSTVSSCSLLPSQHCFSYLVCTSIAQQLMLLYFSVFTLMGTCGRESYCRPFLGGNNCIYLNFFIYNEIILSHKASVNDEKILRTVMG